MFCHWKYLWYNLLRILQNAVQGSLLVHHSLCDAGFSITAPKYYGLQVMTNLNRLASLEVDWSTLQTYKITFEKKQKLQNWSQKILMVRCMMGWHVQIYQRFMMEQSAYKKIVGFSTEKILPEKYYIGCFHDVICFKNIIYHMFSWD